MKSWRTLLLFLLLVCYSVEATEKSKGEQMHYSIINLEWDAVQTPYMISIWLLIAAVAKIIFTLFKPITSYFPDSALLIVVGLALGLFLKRIIDSSSLTLESHSFFLYLLPPIIFDAGYFMPNRALFENMDSVLLFSIVGTIWNTFAIGGSLLSLSYLDLFTKDFTVFEIFVFAALISAVDPVAVIAVFEEMNVNEFLFINVFGEALFNDGVTVVLYHMFLKFYTIGTDTLVLLDYVAGGVNFFVVALGGVIVGVFFAFATAIATKYTYSVRLLAPVFIFILPYMAYLTAEWLSFSSIIAIAVCGMVMKQYIKGNITQSAANSVKYFTKMLAQSTETVIFMFLGISTISRALYFDIWFIVATLVLCLVVRTIGVVVQCWILNKSRHKKFSKVDQFVLSYGGLRGAIAFGLAVSIPETIAAKEMFVTTTITVIYFTVFLQGVTIKLLVNYLNIETKDRRAPTMTESVYNKYLDYMMSGLEDIAGQQGHYSLRDNFERFNAKILRPVLLRDEEKKNFDASSIVRAYAKITLEDAMNITKQQRKLTHPQLHKVQIADRLDGAKDAFSSGESSNPKEKQLKQFLSSGDNIESLYALFSDLLDRKLYEMNTNRNEHDSSEDICDDYMQQIASGSSNNLREYQQEGVARLDNDSRRLSTGDIRMKKSFG